MAARQRSPVRRDRRGALPHARLCLRFDGGLRGALQGRRSGLRLFALRQPDRRDVRGAHGPPRRGGGRARHRDRHGGGDGVADVAGQGRRSRRRGAGDVRRLPLYRRGSAAAFRRRLDLRRRRAISTNGARRCGRRQSRSFWKARPIPVSTSIDIAAIAAIAHETARSSSSTMCSRRRSCRSR